MPKIIIRFDKRSYNYDDAQSFYSEFFESLGLDAEKKFEEQEVEIGTHTEVRLFGMKESVPKNALETNIWVCRLHKSGGLITFSVGDFEWAADLGLRLTSSPKDDLEKACTLNSLNALCIRGAMSLTDVSPLRSLNNLSSLKLGACSSLADLKPLAELSALRSLTIHGSKVLDNISPIASLQSLNYLSIENCSKLTVIPDIYSLKHLNINSCISLKEISPIANIKELVTLDLSLCESLRDISALADLSYLTNLNLAHCDSQIDLSPISNLSNLSDLNLESWRLLTDLTPLSNLKGIKSLNLKQCDSLRDLHQLSGFIYLNSLDISFCKSVSDLSPLSALTNLTNLHLVACELLSDLSPLSQLYNLKNLNLSYCNRLTDLSALSKLASLKILDLSKCKSITSLPSFSNLINLTKLSLDSCESLTDISGLLGLTNLTSLNLSNCRSLSNISPLGSILSLTRLDLYSCDSITDLSPLSQLASLTNLDLSKCKSIRNLPSFLKLINLNKLNLDSCDSLTDISGLSELINLTSLKLSNCCALSNISPLGSILSLTRLDLSGCNKISNLYPIGNLVSLNYLDISYPEIILGRFEKPAGKIINKSTIIELGFLYNLNSIQYLILNGLDKITNLKALSGLYSLESIQFTSRRIQSIEPLRSIPSLREVKEFNPPEEAEILAHAACLRTDRDFIFANCRNWLNEAKGWSEAPPSLQDRFAATLGEAFSLLGESPIEPAYEDFINNRPDFTSSPWKAWFGGTLKQSGFDLYRQRVERVPVSEMLPGAIGGTCATLPYEAQADWSRMWLTALESARLSDAKSLIGVAPEICLALTRLGFTESLRSWLEAFTDPSDPSVLDPVQAALADFQLSGQNLEASESHLFAIQSPSLRDPVLAELVTALADVNPDKASANLLLIENPATRTNLAKSLATSAGFSASETALHRLVVAMGDSPEALGELISSLPETSTESLLIQKISESLRLDRQTTLRKIAGELHRQADRMFYESSSCPPST
jgi:Leucine-rich repeat (LRR) protein